MAKFPLPPEADALRQLEPDCYRIEPGALLWRVYFAEGPHPTSWDSFRYFGPTEARFDHHLVDAEGRPSEQERGIIYLAASPLTALAEVFQDVRRIGLKAKSPYLVGLRAARQTRLLDLGGAFATKMGASMAIHSGPRPRARAWARAIYSAWPGLAGIRYGSSMHAGEPTFAINERGEGMIDRRSDPAFHRPLRDALLLPYIESAAERLGYDVE